MHKDTVKKGEQKMGLNINIQEKSFGRKIIFKDFNYSFPDVGLFVLSGPSGRGKTTLLRIISGLDKDFIGSVEGGDAKNVSYHFQEYRLFENLTALENITEISFKNAEASDVELAKSTLHSLGFNEEEINLFPKQLSGGMKMRVSFARAFLKRSPIILLDEPTKELDYQATQAVEKLILQKSKEALVIMVTHNTDLSILKEAKIIEI